MKLSSREIKLIVVTGLALLLATSIWIAESHLRRWREMSDRRIVARRRIEMAEALIARRSEWTERVQAVREALSRYPPDQDVTADYLRVLERVARENNLTLVQRRPQKEQRQGDFHELAIDCTWEGSLEALVRFLFAIEREELTMDIGELTVGLAPEAAGVARVALRGTFALICIYLREPSETRPEPNT